MIDLSRGKCHERRREEGEDEAMEEVKRRWELGESPYIRSKREKMPKG